MTEAPEITEEDVETVEHVAGLIKELHDYAKEADDPPLEPFVLQLMNKQLTQLHSALALVVAHGMALEEVEADE